MSDYLMHSDDADVHFTFQWLSCSCCSSRWTTDPEEVTTYQSLLDQDHLDKWEREVTQQLENIWKVRQTHIPSDMLGTYHPSMEQVWDVAVIKAKMLGIAWRGRDLPDHARSNEMQAELAHILDWYEAIVDHPEHSLNREANQDLLSSIFFEEYVKLTCKNCGHTGDPITFHNGDYCTEWCFTNREVE